MLILVLNAGSSSWKCALFNDFEPIWEGFLDFSLKKPILQVSRKGHPPVRLETSAKDRDGAVKELIKTAWEGAGAVIPSPDEISIVGHRVVHGGEQFVAPTLITPEVKEAIRSLFPLAPLHNPANLEGIELMEKLLPTCRQVAVFDTAFHRTMPEAVQTYAVPLEWRKEGIRRYGFHGISHAYCSKRAASLLNKEPFAINLISCHLGNGASLTAIRGGRSLVTTMGFTPMEGLMMGTRSGSIDPGILLYQLMEKKMKVEELDKILNFKSGLLGIAGTSDMRELLTLKRKGNPEALLAFEMYVTHLIWHMGALLACLGKPDCIVFAGGIGENSPEIRQAACEPFRTWGIELDPDSNAGGGTDRAISVPGSKIPILVIKTREDLEIAKACAAL